MMIERAIFKGEKLDFFISEQGQIVNSNDYICHVSESGNLYPKHKNGKLFTNMPIAAIVIETFTGEAFNNYKHMICYKDDNKNNVSLDNVYFYDKSKVKTSRKYHDSNLTKKEIDTIISSISKSLDKFKSVNKNIKASIETVHKILYRKEYYTARCGYNIKLAKENFEKWKKESIGL